MPGLLPEPTPTDRPYWDGARDGVLRMQRCDGCDHLFFPAGARCPQCLSTSLTWVDLSGRGTIWSWVVFHRPYFKNKPPPYTVVRVKLEEGSAMNANLVESDGREPSMNAPVEVVFQPTDEGLTLPQFKLV